MSEYDYCDMIEVDNDHLIMCEKEDLVKLIIDMKKERKVRSKRIENIKKNLDGFFDTVIDDIQMKVSDLNDTIEYADDNDDWENEYENNIEEYERRWAPCEVDLNED
tara:strand:- start:1133 stop:1453 length:321 start_codon:yes stop_codon:yes gene_type:complete